VRLAAFGSAWAELVPRAVAAHRAARPEVALVLEEADPRTALARLHAGRLDLAVVFEPNDADPVHAGSLATELLAEDPLRAVLPADHPLAAADAVALDALAGEPWALATDACAAQVRAACEAAGFVPREVFASADYAALQGFVATGSAVALVPALACRPARPGVAVRPLAGAGPRRRLLAAGPAGGHRSPAAGAVVAALRAAAQALLTEPAAPAADVSPARAAPPPPPTRRSRRAAP
jgi:DNA-binding transcriptional LysR family regulator